jgi:hypothetical protein
MRWGTPWAWPSPPLRPTLWSVSAARKLLLRGRSFTGRGAGTRKACCCGVPCCPVMSLMLSYRCLLACCAGLAGQPRLAVLRCATALHLAQRFRLAAGSLARSGSCQRARLLLHPLSSSSHCGGLAEPLHKTAGHKGPRGVCAWSSKRALPRPPSPPPCRRGRPAGLQLRGAAHLGAAAV